ncbi:MAG: hypothetical protein JSR82_21650 [Verrucomicrobia bacterium]|nr:hypothetical protein [Verrucomicrobiota bacterium]
MAALPRQVVSLLVALAICSATGTHWLVLQSVAWAGMIVSYAQDRPLDEAISDTFDGAHPCALCEAISTEKQKDAEQKGESTPGASAKKLVFALHAVVGEPAPFCRAWAWTELAQVAAARSEKPLLPPPRMA